MTIDEALRALIWMGTLPSTFETLVTTVYNASNTKTTYTSATCSILSEDTPRKSFEQTTSSEAYVVHDADD